MHLQTPSAALVAALLLPVLRQTHAQQPETVLAAYIFHRHGDRTAKSLPNTHLTDLGYAQVFQSGSYYRSRYVAASSPLRINAIEPDTVSLKQLTLSAPADNVLQNSAQGFSQALYPPVGGGAGPAAETLRNGSTVRAPLDGYQLIPVGGASSGASGFDAESSTWLQSSSDCANAETSSNGYFYSDEYQRLLGSTRGFYERLAPVVSSTFSAEKTSYKNAYTLFDYVNVATIHNASIPSSSLLDPPTLAQLQSLAATHEYALAYNASSPVRGIAGMTLAAQAVAFLSEALANATKASGPKLGVQFGAYGTFQSFFGLSGLSGLAGDDGATFRAIPDYASSMVWEVYTNASLPSGGAVSADDVYVRFLFKNGSAAEGAAPAAYPLFGAGAGMLRWDDFTAAMARFSVKGQEQWCRVCGNSTGSCAEYAGGAGSGGSAAGGSVKEGGGGGGMSNAVAGVIGAMVTLGVILLVEAAIMLLGGLRVVRRRKGGLGGAAGIGVSGPDGVKA